MSLYLSALQIFLSLKGKSAVEGDSITPEGTEGTNEPKKNENTKKEQNPDSFESSATQAETPETQATKPKTWLEQIADTGKKALDTVSEQTGEIISVAKNLWDNLPEKFKTAQKEHDERVTQIKENTQEAKKIVQEAPKKNEDKEDTRKLSPQELKELNRYIAKVFYEKCQQAKLEQARLEASRQEQARLQQELAARRQEQERIAQSNLLAQRKAEENAKTLSKQELAKNAFMKDLISRYSDVLYGFEMTESTTEAQLVSFLIKSNRLSLDQKQEILAQTGKQDQVRSMIPNDAVVKLLENKQQGLSYSA
jgi:hypothetical protein